MDSLKVSTAALKSGDSTNDAVYVALTNKIVSWTDQRDAIAQEMKATGRPSMTRSLMKFAEGSWSISSSVARRGEQLRRQPGVLRAIARVVCDAKDRECWIGGEPFVFGRLPWIFR